MAGNTDFLRFNLQDQFQPNSVLEFKKMQKMNSEASVLNAVVDLQIRKRFLNNDSWNSCFEKIK